MYLYLLEPRMVMGNVFVELRKAGVKYDSKWCPHGAWFVRHDEKTGKRIMSCVMCDWVKPTY